MNELTFNDFLQKIGLSGKSEYSVPEMRGLTSEARFDAKRPAILASSSVLNTLKLDGYRAYVVKDMKEGYVICKIDLSIGSPYLQIQDNDEAFIKFSADAREERAKSITYLSSTELDRCRSEHAAYFPINGGGFLRISPEGQNNVAPDKEFRVVISKA